MKDRTVNWLIVGLTVLALTLICVASFAAYKVFFASPIPTANAAVVYTQAAQTMIAQITLDAGSTAVSQLTQIARTTTPNLTIPTDTPGPTSVFPTLIPTQTKPTYVVVTATSPIIYLTATPTSPYIPTAPVIPCNRATFIKDVTIPDGAVLPPNTPFTKIWRIRNDGACYWDYNYSLVFVNGTPMTNIRVVPVPAVVYPGQTIDLAVDMVSPSGPGTYQSNWMMRTPRGQIFGFGPYGDDVIFARIRIQSAPKPNPNYSYDFAAYYCNAQWRTNAGVIPCTNPNTASNGSVTYTTNPSLESRTENESALWVRPDQNSSGYISGQYPAYTVKSGDHFVTEVSCVYGFKNCDVTFRLDYILSNGSAYNLGAWHEVYDGKSKVVDVNLSALIGQSVKFVLRMQNNGSVSQANGIWFVPSIRNYPSTSTPLPPTVTPTATRTSTPTSIPTDTDTPTPTSTPTPTLTPPPIDTTLPYP